MFLELKVIEESSAASVVATEGQSVHVGRLKQHNHLCVADAMLAPVHFSISCEGDHGRLTDLSRSVQKHAVCQSTCFTSALRNAQCVAICRLNDRSRQLGVYLNGKKVDSAMVHDGDTLVAGSTAFTVTLSATAPAVAPSRVLEGALSEEHQERLLAFLADNRLPLFGLLDAARDPGVLQLLRTHSDVHYSLYDGADGEKLDDVAPYLVQLSSRSPVTETLVREHWGKSWGIFVWALTDFKELRRHLRRFLLVHDPRGKVLYFRFYDPRVLRVFLPTCTSQETGDFFGPMSGLLLEGPDPTKTWVCTNDRGSLRINELAFFT